VKEKKMTLKRSSKDLLAEANNAVETIPVEQAIALANDPNVVFVDVREGAERAKGTVKGSIHASRGFLEFHADPASPMHKPELASGKKLVLFCGSGGRSALAAKTLKDMGLENVAHVAGGFGAWQKAGGPTQTG
jgi:rhodanese-related sulfurtransferase